MQLQSFGPSRVSGSTVCLTVPLQKRLAGRAWLRQGLPHTKLGAPQLTVRAVRIVAKEQLELHCRATRFNNWIFTLLTLTLHNTHYSLTSLVLIPFSGHHHMAREN